MQTSCINYAKLFCILSRFILIKIKIDTHRVELFMPLSLGQRIKALRELNGLSLEQLAELAGISASTISRYESDPDLVNPRMESLKAVAQALSVRTGYLMGEIEELEGIEPAKVAARESLTLFLAKRSLSERERNSFLRTIDCPGAPKTVGAWKAFEEMMHCFQGKKNGG